MKENKTYVEEGDRSFYDFRYEDKDSYKVASGLTPDIIRQIFDLGKEIKEHFYGNRIVMFAPLYLSNYCVGYFCQNTDAQLGPLH